MDTHLDMEVKYRPASQNSNSVAQDLVENNSLLISIIANT